LIRTDASAGCEIQTVWIIRRAAGDHDLIYESSPALIQNFFDELRRRVPP
jgi:hypothetical protein